MSMRNRIAAMLVSLLMLTLGGVLVGTMPAKAKAGLPKLGTTMIGTQAPKGRAGFVPIKTPRTVLTTCPTGCYEYGGARQTVASDGFVVSVSIENPTITTADAYHSLAEIEVEDLAGNIVEAGWTVDPLVCGSLAASPCFFVGKWTNGVFGGYNGGFTPAVGCSPWCPGASLTALVGTTKSFVVQYLVSGTSTGWWVAVDGTWRGVFLASNWTSPAFTRGQMNQVFGEVAEKNTAPTQCANMGTGTLATGSPTFLGGKFNSYTLVNGAAAASLTAFATTPARWASFNTASNLSNRYGGPGFC